VSQLFRWRKELCQIPAASVQQLVPVQVVEALPAPPLTASPAARPRKKSSMVTIELGGGRRIRVESDVDTEAFGRILDVLERR
jgi:transposase